jgi:hypothetical protein
MYVFCNVLLPDLYVRIIKMPDIVLSLLSPHLKRVIKGLVP